MFLFLENEEEEVPSLIDQFFHPQATDSIIFESIFKQSQTIDQLDVDKLVKDNNPSIFANEDFDQQDEFIIKKREGARIRSKKARDRKKQYLEELEFRVKYLEKENMKLSQELDRYKSEHKEEEVKICLEPSKTIENLKDTIEEKFYKESQNKKELFQANFEEFFHTHSQEIVKSHGEVLDKTFKFLIENAIPKFGHRYFKIMDQPISLTYDNIK